MPSLRTATEVFGWVAAVLGVAACGAAVFIGPYVSEPENRNSEDLIVIPLVLALLSVVFAAAAVAAASLQATRRPGWPQTRTLVPATFAALIVAAFGWFAFGRL